jgi:hypothetical protein
MEGIPEAAACCIEDGVADGSGRSGYSGSLLVVVDSIEAEPLSRVSLYSGLKL